MKTPTIAHRWHLAAFLSLAALWFAPFKPCAQIVTATITFTNAANLVTASGGSGASVTVNTDVRRWTNTITSPGAQIPLTSVNGTNIAQQVQAFLIHSAGHPFAGISPASDGITYVSLRGTNGQALTVTLNPTNYASVTMSTQSIGAAYTLRLPITVEASGVRATIANHLLSALDYATSGSLAQLGTSNATVKPVRLATGLVSLEAGSGMTLATTATSVVFNASGSTLAGNTVWVSKTGNDSSGVRENVGAAFLTLSAAKAAAFSGDTIMVLPGGYADSDLQKAGVNWHFFNGAIVTNNSAVTSIFDNSTGGSGNSDITGDGVFVDPLNTRVLNWVTEGITNSIHCKTMKGTTVADFADGYSTVEADEIVGDGDWPVLFSGTDAVVTINRTRIKGTSVSADGRAVYLLAANNETALRDCVLIVDPGATYSIAAGTTANVRLYGSTMANITNHSGVTFLTGGTRFEVSTDVR